MLHTDKLLSSFGQYGDRWIVAGVALFFLLWAASKRSLWQPWCVRHPILTDFIILFSSAFFILSPLTQFGAPGGHDHYFHLSRVAELDWLIRDGYYYGRWTPDFNYGFGYPLFNFYPLVIYYVAQPFRALGLSVLDALNWVIVIGTLLSGLLMYLFGKTFWGRYGGLVCAVAYMYAPYRILTLYVRGAIPEMFAMTFLPLIFWSVYHAVRTKRTIYLVAGAIGFGLLVPSHNVTAVFFTICLIAYCGFILLEHVFSTGYHWNNVLRPLSALILMGALGVGLSAIYWLPAMAEKQFVAAQNLYTGYHDVAKHFVYLPQFFSRAWGYGGSGEGPDDDMSFQLGLEHVLLAVLSAAVVFWRWRQAPRQRNHTIFYLGMVLCLMFAMTSKSLVFWRTLPLVAFISFPWRLLSLTAFALSFLCGGIMLISFDERFRFGNRIVQLLVIAAILALTVGYCRPKTILPLGDEHFSRAAMRQTYGTALNDEYSPIWSGNYEDQIQNSEIQISAGEADITGLRTTMLSYHFVVTAATPATLRIGMLYFPGWHAYQDGERIPLIPEKNTGLLSFTVAQGIHMLDIRFEDTFIRKVGQYLSLSTFVVLCGMAAWPAFTRRH